MHLSAYAGKEKSEYDTPPKIEVFLKRHFSKYKLEKLMYDTRDGECKVKYTNGYKIEFDKNNEWREIETSNQPIINLLPNNALLYISQNYSRKVILKIKRTTRGYQVKFLEASDLSFDKKGNIIKK